MILAWLLGAWLAPAGEWGFFGHRMINRHAVFTLPGELIEWYKPAIDFVSDHAVDPDKRRYATRHEAVRHYIDLDHWAQGTFDHVPRNWRDALALNLEIFAIDGADTLWLVNPVVPDEWADSINHLSLRRELVDRLYLPRYYDEHPSLPADSLRSYFGDKAASTSTWSLADLISPHGILPYHLAAMQRRLTEAFREGDVQRILRISADLGHYIGDACVPLHTCENYNGQLTGQQGIHAFWESRIPELYAEREFDLLVGRAEYMEDPPASFWQLVLDSHAEVDRVLTIERHLRDETPGDRQLCFEDRLDITVLTQCEPFARAYHDALDHMVEDRFRAAIKAVGDAWYTAWIDAGQPRAPRSIRLERKGSEDKSLDLAIRSGSGYGRNHE